MEELILEDIMYEYTVYGLLIKSEIELGKAEYMEDSLIDSCDVTIRYGEIPVNLVKAMSDNNTHEILSCNSSVLDYPGEVTLYIYNGDNIIVSLYEGFNIEHVRSLILSNGLGMIMVQRDIFAVHGSCVAHNECEGRYDYPDWKDERAGALIITGDSGSGKSTLCAELRSRGLAFLADDTVSLSESYGRIKAYPGLGFAKLCPDAAIEYAGDLSELEFLDEDKGKYSVDVTKALVKNAVTLRAVVNISPENRETIELVEITGSDKLQYIINTMYCYKVYAAIGFTEAILSMAIEISNNVRFFVIKRPINGEVTVKEQADLIMQEVWR